MNAWVGVIERAAVSVGTGSSVECVASTSTRELARTAVDSYLFSSPANFVLSGLQSTIDTAIRIRDAVA